MTSGGKRPGSGAPKKPEPEKRVKTSIQIKKRILDIINIMAADCYISRSQFVESIIQEYIEKHRKSPVTFDNHIPVINKIKH